MRIEEKIGYLLTEQPIVTLRLGDRYANIISGTDLHRISLKFNSADSPKIADFKQTFQYRAMTALGFKTKNGHTYTYQDGEHDIWVRFFRSKVSLLKDNLDYVSAVNFRPRPAPDSQTAVLDIDKEERK